MRPKVFLVHSSLDLAETDVLFDELDACKAEPWMDKRTMPGGADWKKWIPEKIEQACAVVVVFSEGFDEKRRYRHREVSLALEILDSIPGSDRIFIIPYQLRPCSIPSALKPYNVVANFDDLLKAIDAACGSDLRKRQKAVRRRGPYDDHEYSRRISKLVRKTLAPQPLLGIVGRADFAAAWLPRLVQQMVEERLDPTMHLSNVELARLSPRLIREFQRQKVLTDNFGKVLEHNLVAIAECLSPHDVPLSIRELDEVPSYHGWVFGEVAYVAKWSQDPLGRLHVQTKLNPCSTIRHKEMYEAAVGMFKP